MTRVDIWIAENIVNCGVLMIAAALFFMRWRRAIAEERIDGLRHVRYLRTVNKRFMLANLIVSLAFFGLGGYLLNVAREWVGWVPNFVIVGTGFFALAWALFTGAAILHYLALNRVAAIANEEHRRRGGITD